MASDTGLAPNPFFGICSLALCTPNHMNARLEKGDWVLGHTTRSTGRKLVYAMKLTRVIDMPSYFYEYPLKRPELNGTMEQRCGDNLYQSHTATCSRIPSAHHNNPTAFKQDINRKVYLAEGEENFWYFGGNNPATFLSEFPDRFPGLLRDRQGFSYIYDTAFISQFTEWLYKQSKPGLRGQPRDSVNEQVNKYLIHIDPEIWVSREDLQPGTPVVENFIATDNNTSNHQHLPQQKRYGGCS